MPDQPNIKSGRGSGKMSMQDKLGRTMSMRNGDVMQTKEGIELMMRGNEIWRSESVRSPY